MFNYGYVNNIQRIIRIRINRYVCGGTEKTTQVVQYRNKSFNCLNETNVKLKNMLHK